MISHKTMVCGIASDTDVRARWEKFLTLLADIAWTVEQNRFNAQLFDEAARQLDFLPSRHADYATAVSRLERARAHGRRGNFPAAHCEMRRMMRHMLRVAGRDLCAPVEAK